MIKAFIKDYWTFPRRLAAFSREMKTQIEETKILAAKILMRQMVSCKSYENIHEAEFKVFSQFGDDGIIQYLIHGLAVQPRSFVEFGVTDYREANTRFLLLNDNWRGLVMEGNDTDVSAIKQDPIYWKYNLEAVCAFIDKDNINSLLADNGFSGALGLLSIDLDGNDYWIWEAIQAVDPVIVIVEYNSLFGSRRAATVPYDPLFVRTQKHFSNLYWGCSLKALYLLALKKGYFFVGCNSSGNNAYFVRNAKKGLLPSLTAEQGYVESRFRESRDANGRLTYLSGLNRVQAIEEMPVFDVEKQRLIQIKDLREETL